MKHVVLYVGHLYKSFWTKKKLTGLAGGVREGQNVAHNWPCFWLRSPLEASKWVKEPLNGPQMIPLLPLIDLNPFLGSLTHLEA